MRIDDPADLSFHAVRILPGQGLRGLWTRWSVTAPASPHEDNPQLEMSDLDAAFTVEVRYTGSFEP